ncbi:MAG: sulfotransferase [Pseudomonadota bacterium]
MAATELFQKGLAAHQDGKPTAAEGHFRRTLSIAPSHQGALLHLALLCLQKRQLPEGIALLKRLIEINPNLPEAQAHLGAAYVGIGNFAAARDCFLAALSDRPEDAGLKVNLGHVWQNLGDSAKAVALYQEVIDQEPGHGGALNSLGFLYQRQGQALNAEKFYQRALQANPNDPSTHNNLAILYREKGERSKAIEHYQAAIAVAPTPATLSNLAALLERAHRLDEARQAAGAALKRAPSYPEATLILAKLAKREGKTAEAIRRYQSLIAQLKSSGRETERPALARAYHELAGLYEAQGEFDHSLSFFDLANQTNREMTPDWHSMSEAYLTEIAALAEQLERPEGFASLKADTYRAKDEGTADPIFLVGFPRSGTTLLDQILNAHPRLHVLEEKPLLDEVAAALGDSRLAQLQRFGSLSQDQKAVLRRDYWVRAAQWGAPITGDSDADPILVDKLPLNLINLWLVQGLFPRAKVILALRDPRDVCLSCHTNLFRLQAGIAGFPNLEATCTLYHQVMTLWETYRRHTSLAWHPVKYEDLIENLEAHARGLIGFLELDWDPAVLDYRQAAQDRYIVTPSYDQVVQPLYRTSLGRWRHYPKAAELMSPLLRQHIDNFGYES